MSVSAEVLEAKEVLSTRLLQTPAAARAVSRRYERNVSEAAAAADSIVHAVGVGRKITGGQVTATAVVRIYVVQKLPKSMLSDADVLPSEIDGIPTDVIESPPAFFTAGSSYACTNDRRKRQRPVVAGISAAHVDVTAGTIGSFCRSTRAGDDPSQVFVLSNNHVFADVNKAAIGDDLYQQGPADGGTAADRFARLHRYQDIVLGGVHWNDVDAAIGEVLPEVDIRQRVCRIGEIDGTAQAVEEMIVRKHGRTSGYTRGQVTDESVNSFVGMEYNNPLAVANFSNQMRIDRIPPYPAFGLGGDSGSLVVTERPTKAVGLFFAGPEDGSYGLANHIADVLAALEIELL